MTQTDRTPTVVPPVVYAGVGIVLTLGLAVAGTVASDNLLRLVLVGGVVAALVIMAATTVAHRARADSLEAELATMQRQAGADRSAALAESRRQLVAWVSDDLHTPLARLQATATALEDGTIDQPIEVAAALAVMSREIEGVAALVGDLHELSHGPVQREGDPGPVRLPGTASPTFSRVDDRFGGATPSARAGGAGVSTFDAVFRVVPDPLGGHSDVAPTLGGALP